MPFDDNFRSIPGKYFHDLYNSMFNTDLDLKILFLSILYPGIDKPKDQFKFIYDAVLFITFYKQLTKENYQAIS